MQLCRAQSGRWTPPTSAASSGFKAHAHPRRLHRMALRVSSNSDAPSTSASQQEDRITVEQLQQQMADAVASEKYDVAAAIRDQLLSLDVSQPEDVLKLQLKAAIAEERFSEAARLRDEIKALQPSCSSDTVTNGVRITASSVFEGAQTGPDSTQYLYVYTIEFRNESERTVKLVDREWKITDGKGVTRYVRGEGVVGRTPILKPGASYRYKSACALSTPRGSLSGHFGFIDALSSFTEGLENKFLGDAPSTASLKRAVTDDKLLQTSDKWSKPYKVICDEFALRVEE